MLKIVIFLEILIVNLIVTHFNCTKKFTTFITVVVLSVFSLVLYTGFFFLAQNDIPNVVFVFIGFIYIFPLIFIYEGKTLYLFTVMVFAWSHSMLMTGIASQISYSFYGENAYVPMIFIQSSIYIISTPIFIKYFVKKFVKILQTQEIRMKITLSSMFLTIFAYIIIIRNFVPLDHGLLYFSLAFLCIIFFILINKILYTLTLSKDKVSNLNSILYTDSLTGVQNRLSLFKETNNLIENNIPFTLVFMDLDNLKSINDNFGHNFGDEYLQKFVAVVQKDFEGSGTLYRIAGDEFIYIITDPNKVQNITELEIKVVSNDLWKVKFEGVSIGMSNFPSDSILIDELISRADKNMYTQKRKKRKYR